MHLELSKFLFGRRLVGVVIFYGVIIEDKIVLLWLVFLKPFDRKYLKCDGTSRRQGGDKNNTDNVHFWACGVSETEFWHCDIIRNQGLQRVLHFLEE